MHSSKQLIYLYISVLEHLLPNLTQMHWHTLSSPSLQACLRAARAELEEYVREWAMRTLSRWPSRRVNSAPDSGDSATTASLPFTRTAYRTARSGAQMKMPLEQG